MNASSLPGLVRPAGTARHRVLVRGLAATAVAVGLLSGVAGTASADINENGLSGSTDANVAVSGALQISALTDSFTLTGLPDTTVADEGAVDLTVKTNDPAGYSVTVQAAAEQLSSTGANTDTIPIGNLSVKEGGTDTYQPLSATDAVTVHTQAVRSAPTGDVLTNDYSVDIPFVNPGTYTTTLNYVVASTL